MLIVAAGYGTRIRSLFPDTPKALIEVGSRALIDHLLANLARSGTVESALVDDRFHDAVRDHLAAGAPPLPARVISDGERLGALSLTVYVLTPATQRLLATTRAGRQSRRDRALL